LSIQLKNQNTFQIINGSIFKINLQLKTFGPNAFLRIDLLEESQQLHALKGSMLSKKHTLIQIPIFNLPFIVLGQLKKRKFFNLKRNF